MRIEFDDKELLRLKQLLQNIPGAYQKAMRRSLKRTLSQLQTASIQKIAENYYVKKGDIRRSFSVRADSESGIIQARGRRMSIKKYKFTPQRPGAKSYKGAVRRDGLKRFDKAFMIGLGASKNIYYPFIRVGRDKWDIKTIVSPAIPQLWEWNLEGKSESENSLTQKTSEFFMKNFEHEALFELGFFSR